MFEIGKFEHAVKRYFATTLSERISPFFQGGGSTCYKPLAWFRDVLVEMWCQGHIFSMIGLAHENFQTIAV
jgi:hypothetical protein